MNKVCVYITYVYLYLEEKKTFSFILIDIFILFVNNCCQSIYIQREIILRMKCTNNK